MISDYQSEQLMTIERVRQHLDTLGPEETGALHGMLPEYLAYRQETDRFLETHFSRICTDTCYRNRLSACCTRDGIITFFGDLVINVLHTSPAEHDALVSVLRKPHTGFKCVYLGEEGCLWRIKPLVCQMFLCDPARKEVFGEQPSLEPQWNELKERKKRFTWPDRPEPVLFDALEQVFLDAGVQSPLMYLHNSPGLLRIKQLARRKETVHEG